MGDVSISRGKGFLDDFTDLSPWTLTGPGTTSTDGDFLTLANIVPGSTIYERALPAVRVYDFPWLYINLRPLTAIGQLSLGMRINMTDNSYWSNNIPVPQGKTRMFCYQEDISASIGDTVYSKLSFRPNSDPTAYMIDFIMFCKEKLVIPGAEKPMPVSYMEKLIDLPILQRAGGISQDMGSLSPMVDVSGSLFDTALHTAGDYWDIMVGVWNEQMNPVSGSSVTGLPVWQWFNSDRFKAKVLVENVLPVVDPGRVNDHDFTMRLRQYANDSPLGPLSLNSL